MWVPEHVPGVPMAADGEADDLPGDLLSLHVELLGNVAKALPRKARLAFSLTARPLNAARMNANLKLKTSPRALMGGTPALALWPVSIGWSRWSRWPPRNFSVYITRISRIYSPLKLFAALLPDTPIIRVLAPSKHVAALLQDRNTDLHLRCTSTWAEVEPLQ